MKAYLLTIKMPDGSVGRCRGMFANDWDAITTMLDAFGDARMVSARRLAS